MIFDFYEPHFLSATLILHGKAIVPTSVVAFDVLHCFVTILAEVVYPPDRLRETACSFFVVLASHKVVESFLHLSLRNRAMIINVFNVMCHK